MYSSNTVYFIKTGGTVVAGRRMLSTHSESQFLGVARFDNWFVLFPNGLSRDPDLSLEIKWRGISSTRPEVAQSHSLFVA